MSRKHAPRKGSMQFSPRVRAMRPYPRIRTWPQTKETRLLGFAGYKAGMTHTFVLDTNKNSPTANQEVFTPATVLECPPLFVFAVRCYNKTPYGLEIASEFWADKIHKFLPRKTSTPNKAPSAPDTILASHITLLVHSMPSSIDLKKTPEIFEIAIGGQSFDERLSYAKSVLGKEIRVSDLLREGEFVDVVAVTKGKGTQGPVKRFGIKIKKRKHARAGHSRNVGSLGDRKSAVRWTVPMMGQMGYGVRTEFNKIVLKIGKQGEAITPDGGFLNYGEVRHDFILLKGSVPGPAKRLVRIKIAIRPPRYKVEKPNITYISMKSMQGK